MKPKAIIVDIDGTLANAKHRVHLLEAKPKKWKEFFASAKDDKPNEWCLEIIKEFIDSNHVFLLTGRGEEERENTENWLEDNNIEYDTLLMRPAGDRRADYVVKEEIYLRDIKPYNDVLFVVEDRGSVVRMWRSIGLTCLQCDDWEERDGNNIHKEVAAYYQKMSKK